MQTFITFYPDKRHSFLFLLFSLSIALPRDGKIPSRNSVFVALINTSRNWQIYLTFERDFMYQKRLSSDIKLSCHFLNVLG